MTTPQKTVQNLDAIDGWVNGDENHTQTMPDGVIARSPAKAIADIQAQADALAKNFNLTDAGFDFATGGTIETYNQLVKDASGNSWQWQGSLPHIVAAGTIPSSPDYEQRTFNEIDNISGLRDELDVRATHMTLAQAQVSDLKEGQYVRLVDFGNALHVVVSDGDVGGSYKSLTQSGRKLRYRPENGVMCASHVVKSGEDLTQALQVCTDNQSVVTLDVDVDCTIGSCSITSSLKIKGSRELTKKTATDTILLTGLTNNFSLVGGWTFNGNEQGVIGETDFEVRDCNSLVVGGGVTFKNAAKSNIFTRQNINIFICMGAHFVDGYKFSGVSEATSTFHIKHWASTSNVYIENNTFQTDIVYDNPTGAQADVVAAAPIAVYVSACKTVKVQNNTFINSGHIDIYSYSDQAYVAGNTLRNCHHPSIKVQGSREIIVECNVVKQQLATWGAGILIQPYARADSYGAISRNQSFGLIKGNTVSEAVAGISLQGFPLTQDVLDRDPTITQDDLLAEGYILESNIIRQVQNLAISTRFTKDIKISQNILKSFGLAGNATSNTHSGILCQRFYGTTEISGNIIDGGDGNPRLGVYFLPDGMGGNWNVNSVAKVNGNTFTRLASQSVYVTYNETIQVTGNHFEESMLSSTTHVQTNGCVEVVVKDNTGYDKALTNCHNLTNYTKIIDDRYSPYNEYYSNSEPTSGTYKIRDLVHNLSPATGEYIGWVCVQSGTFGEAQEPVFKGYGLIS